MVKLYLNNIPKYTTILQQITDEQGNVSNIEIQQPVLDEQGNQVYDIIPEYTPKVEQSIIDINYMGQYDWFDMIAKYEPVIIHDMIRVYGSQVDWNIKLK